VLFNTNNNTVGIGEHSVSITNYGTILL